MRRLARFSAILTINHLQRCRSGEYMLCLMGKALRDHPNKLGAGNAGIAVCGPGGSPGQVLSGREGRIWPGNFGDRAAAGSDRGGLVDRVAAIGVGGRNGGFLPFRLCARGRVRMVESEWQGQGLGFAGFPVVADQPDRLHRGAGRSIEAGPGGGDPLRTPHPLPLPVAYGRCRSGEKVPARSGPIDLCQAGEALRVRIGRDIPSILMGSGVRAARSAGVNDRSACRPKSCRIVGLGGEWSRSCAIGVNEASKLGPGAHGVN